MQLKSGRHLPSPPSVLSQRLTIESYMAENPTFVSAYATALGAAAGLDGVTSLTEISLLLDLAAKMSSPAVVGAVMFTAILEKADLGDALSDLAQTSQDIDTRQREAAFVSALPLLALQGPPARKAAARFAKALGVKHDMFDVPDIRARALFDEIIDETRRRLSKGDLADAMLVCGRSLGHWGVIEHYEAYRTGSLSKTELFTKVKSLRDEILIQANEAEANIRPVEGMQTDLDDAAVALREQLRQRFVVLEQRLKHETESFAQEIDDLVHDAGNAFERAVQDRLMTDDWKKTQVWESISRMDFAREAESRIDRVLRRREEGLRLLHDELRLFRNQIEISRRIAFERTHYARYEGLMPPLQLTSRMLHRLDELAKATLGTGGFAAISTGAAVHYLGAATVFTALAPIAPYVGGALLAAGIVKWLLPPNERRKYAEIRDKRQAFERVVRDKLLQAQVAHTAELESVWNGFCQVAPALLAPVTLEAEAVRVLPRLRKKLVTGAVGASRAAVKQLRTQVDSEAVSAD